MIRDGKPRLGPLFMGPVATLAVVASRQRNTDVHASCYGRLKPALALVNARARGCRKKSSRRAKQDVRFVKPARDAHDAKGGASREPTTGSSPSGDR
jgi:hypothetical protein